MRRPIEDVFPKGEILVYLEPEEIGSFLLDYLCEMEDNREQLYCYNLSVQWALKIKTPDVDLIQRVIIETWQWLENEGLIAVGPSGGGHFVTRRGRRLRKKVDIEAYVKGSFLNKNHLDEKLVQDVYPIYIRGDYDTSVFAAYKAVEVRVREKAGLPPSEYGVDLMKAAFHPENGVLVDKNVLLSERQAICNLFLGIVGIFKNPASHRDVNYSDPQEVAEIILFANYLLRLTERYAKGVKETT